MTHEELENYINTFREDQRDIVYKQIVDSQLLAKAFSSTEGKLILDSAVDLIAADVIAIVSHCTKGDKNMEIVFDAAKEINTTYKIMTDWAKILIRGSEHKNKITKENLK